MVVLGVIEAAARIIVPTRERSRSISQIGPQPVSVARENRLQANTV